MPCENCENKKEAPVCMYACLCKIEIIVGYACGERERASEQES